MAEPSRGGRVAILLVLLFVVSSMQPLLSIPTSTHLQAEKEVDFTAENQSQILNIATWPDGFSNSLKLEVPIGEALTDVNLSMEPGILARDDIISWTSEPDWNHTDASPESVNYNNTGLTMAGADMEWDFEGSTSLPSGWTTTNTNYGLINTMSCGTNGSSARSLTLRHGTVTVTSDTIDLSSLSQGTFSMWMTEGRSGCGEDPDSSEHLYVEYKRSSGSWGQITYYNANQGTPGYTNVNSQFTLPSDALHSNFQFRFRLPRGSGTCCDWWFVDDIKLTTPGGAGNWTSPSFGSGQASSNPLVPGPYGLISFDVELPGTSIFNWSVLDATTLQPIPGFEHSEEMGADLGIIDWQRHPLLRIRLSMQAGGGGVPTLYGVHLNGKYVNSFYQDPAEQGWLLEGSTWSASEDHISGSGNFTTPTLISARPLARLATNLQITGSGQLFVEVDGGGWQQTLPSTIINLANPSSIIQFKWVGSGQWTLSKAEIDFVSGGMPLHPRIDVARDDVNEWALDHTAIGPWGWQDRLSTGYVSADLPFTGGGSHTVSTWLPSSGIGHLKWALNNVGSSECNATWWNLKVGSTQIANDTVGILSDIEYIILDDNQTKNLNDNLSYTNPIWASLGLSYVQTEIEVGCDWGSIRVGGLSAPYDSSINLSFRPSDPLVLSVNDEIPSSAIADGKRLVPLPMGMDLPGSLRAEITGLYSVSGLQTPSAILVNSTSTLAPSYQWLELNSQHVSTVGSPDRVQMDLIGLNNQTTYEWPVSGGAPIEKGQSGLVRFHPDTPHLVTSNLTHVNSSIRFQLEPAWDDEERFEIRVRLVLADGRRSIPQVASFGYGQQQGIENDPIIRSWDVRNDLGIVVPAGTDYLRGARNVSIHAQLGFESTDTSLAPRSGDVRVELYENDVEIHNSTTFVNGLYNHTFLVPPGANTITYRLELVPLRGGWDMTTINTERTFQTDSLAPLVIATNLEHYDHLQHSANQQLKFEIYDRPVLPGSINVMLWREWLDDYNFNSWPDEVEYSPYQLAVPSNLSMSQGNYTYTFDDNGGSYGDKVAGYLVGSDPAGNPLLDGGGPGPDDHLFMYELSLDGAPIAYGENATMDGDRQPWLHPGNEYDLVIPFTEPNGYSDLDEIRIELASNADSDVLTLKWSRVDNRCISLSELVTIEDCRINAQDGDIGPYVDDLELELAFTIDWLMISQGDRSLEPTMEIFDRARQSTYISMPHLRWRWSTDLHVPYQLVSITVEDGVPTTDGAWASPGSSLYLQGLVTFSASGQTPQEYVEIAFNLDGERVYFPVLNGSFSAEMQAPFDSGSHPLSWQLAALPQQASDVTDTASAIFWIVVDGQGPSPVEVVAPRTGRTLPIEELGDMLFDVRIEETQEIDADSLVLNWLVTEGSDPKGPMVAEGTSAMIVPGGALASMQLPVVATVDISSGIDPEAFIRPLSLHIWVTGNDAAGNPMVSTSSFNSDDSPFNTWELEQRVAIWQVAPSDIDYSKQIVEVDETMTVTVRVHNVGTTGGTGAVLVEGVNLAGFRTVLQSTEVTAEPGEVGIVLVDWRPASMGIQWIEVSVPGTDSVKGQEIDVKKPIEEGFFSGALGGIDPIILLAFIILATALLVVGLMWLKESNNRRESKWESEYWDEEEAIRASEEADSHFDAGADQRAEQAYVAAKAAEYDQIYEPNQPNQPSPASPSQPNQPSPASPEPRVELGQGDAAAILDPYAQALATPQESAPSPAPSSAPSPAPSPAPPSAAPAPTPMATSATAPPGHEGEANWVQDEKGQWWKKNDEGYWWRKDEAGDWHAPAEGEYGWE